MSSDAASLKPNSDNTASDFNVADIRAQFPILKGKLTVTHWFI